MIDISNRSQSRERVYSSRAHSSRGSQESYDSEYSDDEGRRGSAGFNIRDSSTSDEHLLVPSTYDNGSGDFVGAGVGVSPQAPIDYEQSLVDGGLS